MTEQTQDTKYEYLVEMSGNVYYAGADNVRYDSGRVIGHVSLEKLRRMKLQ